MMATIEAAFVEQHERGWTKSEEMLATLIELVSELVIVTIRANTAKDDQGKLDLKPIRVPRPGDDKREPPKVRTLTGAEFAAMMGPRKKG